MQITDVRLKKVEGEDNKVKAVASITFDNVFVVHGLRVIQGTEKLFVVMPSKKSPTGEFKDIAHPLVQSMRDTIEERVIEEYNKQEL